MAALPFLLPLSFVFVTATTGDRAAAGSCVMFVALSVSVVTVTAGVTVIVGDCTAVAVERCCTCDV